MSGEMNTKNIEIKNTNETENETESKIEKNVSEEKKVKKKKKKVPRCDLEGCNEPQSILIGVCKWCNLHFCKNHRLPEQHMCSGLSKCKDVAFNNNSILNGQKIVCNKVEKI